MRNYRRRANLSGIPRAVLGVWLLLWSSNGKLGSLGFQMQSHGNGQIACARSTSRRILLASNGGRSDSRRDFLDRAVTLAGGAILSQPSVAAAFFFGNEKDRRQKELCLVNLIRLRYWALTLATTLGSTPPSGGDENDYNQVLEKRKNAYLEARLGAKAMVAEKQRVGGGASPRVFMLVSLQVKDCLDDLRFYAKNKKIDQLKDDLVEALASIVEFDGLETTQDPSPRSSLTLSQYNDRKAMFVRRMLEERVAPLSDEIIRYFGPEIRLQCESYVEQYYPNELPPRSPRIPADTGYLSATNSAPGSSDQQTQ